MPTDKLEDFILDNREAFDDDVPAPKLWDHIEAAIDADGDENGPFELFVANNRAAFDDRTPPPRIEGALFAALDEQGGNLRAGATPLPPLRALGGRRHTLRVLGIAASFLLLLFAAFAIGNNQGYRAAEDDLVADQLRQISPELAETETYFRNEIAAQFTKVELINDDPQLRKDLAAIDVAAEGIRADLLEVPTSQRAALVDKLIETYRTKLNILLRIQAHQPSSKAPASTTQQPTDEL
jgi:hypothetical protein